MRATSMATPFATLYSEYALWLTSLVGQTMSWLVYSCMCNHSVVVLGGMLEHATRNTFVRVRWLAERACFSQGWHKFI